MKNSATEEEIHRVVKKIESLGYNARPIPGSNRTAIGIIGNQHYIEYVLFTSKISFYSTMRDNAVANDIVKIIKIFLFFGNIISCYGISN